MTRHADESGLSISVSCHLDPGLGQLINGDGAKGAMFLLLYGLSIVLMFILIGFLIAPVVWVWSMIDAYTSAQRWNRAHGIIS